MLIRGLDHVNGDHRVLRELIEQGFEGVDAQGVEVHVRPARHSAESFAGRAYAGRPARTRLHPSTVYLVVLVLPRTLRNRGYPKTHRYRGLKTAPWIRVDSWDERLLALASHEACHIRQFRGKLRRSEIEAERWALRALDRHRSRRLVVRPAPRAPVGKPVQLELFASLARA